ncbi:MAG: histidinol-phosphate transaminase [Methylotetracoccus sp.]
MNGQDDPIARLLRPELAELSAYHVPPSRGLIKLDAMENPYTWPESMIEAWLVALREAALNRYPDPTARELCEALRVAGGVPDGSGLLLGNGSDELIQIILMALAPGSVVMAPEPTFVMYRQIAIGLGLRFVGVPLRRDDFGLDMDVMRRAMSEHRPAAVFLAYPNNPTGNLFHEQDVAAIIDAAPGLVVVDEAYAPFAGASFMSRVCQHRSLLVMRTLSKLGLAGLRLGYLAGPPALLGEFDKLRLPYNINVLTQVSAAFALARPEVFDDQVARILAERTRLFEALGKVPGIRVYPSRANFILFELQEHSPATLFRELEQRGVLIKQFGAASGPLSACLRVTVGTPDENSRFLDALAAALSV